MKKSSLHPFLKSVITLIAILTSLTAVRGQYIHGVVKNKADGSPLSGASVQLHQFGTSTNALGEFHIKGASGTFIINIRHVGYQSYSREIILNEDTIFLQVILIPEISSLEEVVVSASTYSQPLMKTSASMEILRPALINNKNQIRLDDALSQVPGLTITEKTANIRGGSGWSYGTGTRVQMLVDNLPLISGDANTSQWELAPLFSADRIEVLKGASSVLYGSSAMNGVIHLLSQPRPDSLRFSSRIYSTFYDKPRRGELKWWKGIKSEQGINFNLEQPFKNGGGLVSSGIVTRDPGFRYLEDDNRGKIFAKYFFPDLKKGLNASIAAHLTYADGGEALLWEDVDHAYIPLDSNITQSSGWDYYIDPRISYSHGRFAHQLLGRYLKLNNNAVSSQANYSNSSDQFIGQYQLKYALNKLILLGGLSATSTSSTSVLFNGKHKSQNQAVFFQADYQPLTRLNINLGWRYENYQLDDREVSKPVLRGGLNYGITKTLSVRAGYGQAFRFPAISETFTQTALGPVLVYPNEELQAESGYTAEVGVKKAFISKSFSGFLDISAFYMEYSEMIEYTFGNWGRPFTFNGLGFKPLNIGPTTIKGAEMSLNLGGKLTKNLGYAFLGGYTYTLPQTTAPEAVIDYDNNLTALSYLTSSSDLENNILKYRYQHLAKADLQLNYFKWKAGGSVRYNSFMQNIDAAFNTFVSGLQTYRADHHQGDFIIDLRLGYKLNNGIEIDLLVDNAFNRERLIRPGLLGPPRTYTFRLSFSAI